MSPDQNLQADAKKLEAAGTAALADLNKAQTWVEKYPRLASICAFALGLILGAIGMFWRVHSK